MHKYKETRKALLDIVAMHDPDRVKKFSTFIQSIFIIPLHVPLNIDLESKKVYTRKPWSPSEKKTHTNKHWFEEYINVLLLFIKAKLQAYVEYQHDQSIMSLNRLREARKVFRRTPKNYANEFWLKTSASIKAAADRADTKSVYDGIRKAVGPTKKLISPLQSATGEILHNRDKQIGRWVQHFSLLYSKQNIITFAHVRSANDGLPG